MQRITWALLGMLLVSLLAVPASAADQGNAPGVPGTLNYVEGQVFQGDQKVDSTAIGTLVLQPNQTLSSETGKAELLLIPGVFLRLGSNSSVRLISGGLAITELELERSQAIVEVDEIHPQNNLRIRENGITVRMEKTGLYAFDVGPYPLRVFEGKANVEGGNRHFEVKSEHQLYTGNEGAFTVQKFDRKLYAAGDLYNWSSLRSAYLAEANVNEAGYYAETGGMPGGPLWWGSAWYWDPWFDAYTFLPGDGIFYSSYGWGFYSPWCVRMAPYYGSTYWYGNRATYRHFSTSTAQWGNGAHYTTASSYKSGVFSGPGSTHGGFHSGSKFTSASRGFGMGGAHGFRGGGAMHAGGGFFHGGGFHGGGFGGGFHGGGFGGGFHGGGGMAGHGR